MRQRAHVFPQSSGAGSVLQTRFQVQHCSMSQTLFTLHFFTCSCTLFFSISRRVETKHPVYALLAQCLVVQAVLQFMFCGITLVRSFAIDKEWGKMAHLGSMFLIALLRQFYETSWACVSYLRWVKMHMLQRKNPINL